MFVRSVIELIASVTRGCHESVTLRDASRIAAQKLVALFPGSSVIVFEREPGKNTIRAVVGANMPSSWHMRAVTLAEFPMLERALRRPQALTRATAVSRERWGALVTQQAICAAIPDPGGPQYALMFLGPTDTTDGELRETALEAVRHLLSASAILANGDATRPRTLAAIHHAKLEWEQMADALPEVVGLLDRRGRVVRVGRGLERWGLGNVTVAIGRDLHSIFHPGCGAGDCLLRGAIAKAWQDFATASSAKFECADPTLGMDLAVDLQPVPQLAGSTSAPPWHRVAFTVANVTSLRCAERELTALNQTLEQRVEERTTQINDSNHALKQEVARRREMERSLRKSKVELQGLSERLMSAQEEERKRIAQDLHDTIGQSLSAVKYSLERAQELGRRNETASVDETLSAVIRRVQRVLDEVRGISMNLRPALLDDLGAASAVRWLCREWHDVYRDIAVEADIEVADTEIPPMLGTSVFRSVQELLNNVARHSAAQSVSVRMRLESGTLSVSVADDGTGFQVGNDGRTRAGEPGPQGLRGLLERAGQTGGRCHVESSPGRGTTVRLEWPVAPGLAAREANVILN